MKGAEKFHARFFGAARKLHHGELLQRARFLAIGEMLDQRARRDVRPIAAERDHLDEQRNAGLAQFGKRPRRFDRGGERRALDEERT